MFMTFISCSERSYGECRCTTCHLVVISHGSDLLYAYMLHGTTSNMLLDVIWSIRQVILSEKKQNCLQMSCSWYAGVHKFFGRISWIELIFLQLLLCYLCYLPSQSCLRCTVSEPWPVDWSNLWRTEKCRCWSVSRLALKPLGFFSLIKVEVKVENCPVSFQELGQQSLHQLAQYLSLLLDLEPVNTTEWNVEE